MRSTRLGGVTAAEAKQLEAALLAAELDPEAHESWPIWDMWQRKGLCAALAALANQQKGPDLMPSELLSFQELGTTLAQSSQHLAQAESAFDTAQANAPRPEHFSLPATYEAEHAAYVERVLTPTEAETTRAAAIAVDVARAALEAIGEHGFAQLNPAAQARLGTLTPLIRDEAERLSIPDLLTRVRQAALSGDTTKIYLLCRYGKMRLAAGGADAQAPEQQQARAQLASALTTLEGRLIAPEHAQLRTQALKVLERARTLETRATARLRASQRYTFESPNDVRW